MTVCDVCMQLCNGLGPLCDECSHERDIVDLQFANDRIFKLKEQLAQAHSRIEKLRTALLRYIDNGDIGVVTLEQALAADDEAAK